MQEPLISVIIPTYGRGDAIRDAIDSVLRQTHENLELIVVDDCSPVPVSEKLSDYTDSRLKIIRHSVNQGQAAGRNTGAANARGTFLAFLDDDDYWQPEKLAQQLSFMRTEGATVSITDYQTPTNDRQASKDDVRWLSYSGQLIGWASSMVIQKDVFDKIGRFDTSEKLRRVEDWDLAIQIQQAREKMVVVPEPLISYAGNHRGSAESERYILISMHDKYSPVLKGREKRIFENAIGWKIARAEMGLGKPVKSMVKLGLTIMRHPIGSIKYGKIYAEKHIRTLLRIEPGRRPAGAPADRAVTHRL